MNIETQIQEDHQAKITVEVEPEKLESAMQRAAAKIAKKVRIPGFRPGKAPYHIILRQVGEAAVMEEAVEIVVNDIYPDVVKESGVKAYGPGQVNNIPSTDPLKIEFLVPLEGEVELGDYQSIRQPYEPPAVTDEEVEKVVEDLRERQAVIEPVERPAQDGDEVTVKMSAERLNPSEGQNATLIREQSNPVVIKANDPDEWPFPGFSAHLVGMSTGESKEIEYTWPEDAVSEALRGTSAKFNIAIEAVKSRTLPELNDEFVSELGGDFNTVEELRANVRKMLEEQSLASYHQKYDAEVLKTAVEQASFKFSPQMLHDEMHVVMHELEDRLQRQGMDLDLYKKVSGMDDEALHEQSRPTAEARLKNGLYLVELGKAEKIEITPDELQGEAINTMNYLLSNADPKELKKVNQQELFRRVVSDVFGEMMSTRTRERLRQIASDGAFVPPARPAPAAEGETEAEVDGESENDTPEISIKLTDENDAPEA